MALRTVWGLQPKERAIGALLFAPLGRLVSGSLWDAQRAFPTSFSASADNRGKSELLRTPLPRTPVSSALRDPPYTLTASAGPTRRAVGTHVRDPIGNPYGLMEGGSVDELLGVTVEGPVLDQLQVEVGRTLEDRVHSGLSGDDREDRHLDAVDEAGGHQRPVHGQAAVGAQRHLRLLLEAGDDVDGVAIHDGRVW